MKKARLLAMVAAGAMIFAGGASPSPVKAEQQAPPFTLCHYTRQILPRKAGQQYGSLLIQATSPKQEQTAHVDVDVNPDHSYQRTELVLGGQARQNGWWYNYTCIATGRWTPFRAWDTHLEITVRSAFAPGVDPRLLNN